VELEHPVDMVSADLSHSHASMPSSFHFPIHSFKCCSETPQSSAGDRDPDLHLRPWALIVPQRLFVCLFCLFLKNSYGAFHLYSEVRISDFRVGSFRGNGPLKSDFQLGKWEESHNPCFGIQDAAPLINSRESCSDLLLFSTSVYLCSR